MNNKGADQTAQMRRLICAFIVRIWQNRFSYDEAHSIMTKLEKKKSINNFVQVRQIVSNDMIGQLPSKEKKSDHMI